MVDDISGSTNYDRQECEVLVVDSDNNETTCYGTAEGLAFVLNPMEECLLDGCNYKKVKAFKTSSHRTFYVPDFDCMVKTHFAGRISSVERDVSEEAVKDSASTAIRLLSEISVEKGISILPEFAGVVREGVGCIYRSRIPYPFFDCSMIPYFSLVGVDRFNSDDLPLYQQIANELGEKHQNFLFDSVIEPMIQTWKYFTFDQLMKVGVHGQNLLFGIDDALSESRPILRDLRGRLRYQSLEDLSEEDSLAITESYDFHMGHLFFDKLKEMDYVGLSSRDFKGRVKEIASCVLGDYRKCFNKNRVYIGGIGHQKNYLVLDKKPKYR